jgi:hypothetical protein
MPAGGKRSTTWNKENAPRKKKGAKAARTLMKEAIGLQNWEGFQQYVKTEGATKLMEEMKKLKGRDFVAAMQAMSEYVLPKLARQEVKIKGNVHLSDEPISFE